MNTPKNDEKDTDNEQANEQSDPYNNNASIGPDIEDIQDFNNNFTNITSEEERSNSTDNNSINDPAYASSAHISVLQSCKTDEPKQEPYSGCDLKNQAIRKEY
jgi:hypothetical protein